MNCDHFVELMSEYMEKELSEGDLSLWEKHFSDCPPCADFFNSFQSSVDLVAHLKGCNCPKEVSRRLESMLVEKANQKKGVSEA